MADEFVFVFDEVRYEAHIWGNIVRAMQDIVTQVNGLRLTHESFDPNFFGLAVRGHNEVAQKVRTLTGEGVDVTGKIQKFLVDYAEHFRQLTVNGGGTVPPPRVMPPAGPEQSPAQWQEELRARLGIPSIEEMEGHLRSLREGSVRLAQQLRDLSRVANEKLAQLESGLWRLFMPRAAILARLIRETVTKVLEFCNGYLQIVAWVIEQARLPVAMYQDALRWVAVRNKANEIGTWLAPDVLNPERGRSPELRRQRWRGRTEVAYADALPGQTRAASSIGLMGLVTGGSLMGCFGAQVYVLSVMSSLLVDVTTAIAELILKISTLTLTVGWYELFFSRLPTWAKSIKEAGLSVLQAEATSKFNAAVFQMLTNDNSAFAYRADLQLYNSVRQLPIAWPDPTRAGVDWPREVRNAQGQRIRWEVSRDPSPQPLPGELSTPAPSRRP
jgi:hypothetical protein